MVIIKTILYIYEDDGKLIEQLVKYSALITGPSRYCKTYEFKEQYNKFDYICFVLSETKNKYSEKILNFINDNIEWLKEKKIVLFYNSDKQLNIYSYIEKIHQLLDENIKYEDKFCLNTEEFHSKELKEKFIEYAAKVRDIMEADIEKYPEDLLKSKIEDFLKSHNTCTLCTASDNMIIGTPIEYMYENGTVYIITEGGRKFINILRNENISIAVYESYSGFANLEGLQLSGKATIIDFNDGEYDDVIKLKKLEPENIKKFNMFMNVIKIDLNRATFLSSNIKKEGYEAKQVITF